MELELVEPQLFLGHAPGAADRLAAAITRGRASPWRRCCCPAWANSTAIASLPGDLVAAVQADAGLGLRRASNAARKAPPRRAIPSRYSTAAATPTSKGASPVAVCSTLTTTSAA